MTNLSDNDMTSTEADEVLELDDVTLVEEDDWSDEPIIESPYDLPGRWYVCTPTPVTRTR